MTINQAFRQLINNKELSLKSGMSESNYRKIKQRFNNDSLTDQLKKKYLLKMGYSYKETWRKK